VILIIEGADLVGKSTLAKRLAAAYELPIVKIRWTLVGDTEVETRAMARTTVEILHATHLSAIFDRLYFSWWAYGHALGKRTAYMHELIDKFSEIENARLILLTATDEELTRRFNRKPDLYFPIDVILRANARYPSLLPLLPESLPSLHIDTTINNADAVFAQAKAFIEAGKK
jgi:thymidylate kinase